MGTNRGHLVAIQMQMELATYRSPEAFRERITSLMQEVRRRVPEGELIVVFPEDVGLWLIFTQDYERVRSAKTVREAGARLMERLQINPFSTDPPAARQVLVALSPFVKRVYHETFSAVAKQFRSWIVAGSAPIAEGNQVYNTCYTYNPKGVRVATHRKINLVELEQEGGLAFCPAPNELPVVSTPLGKLGVVICLDGFHHELIEQQVKQGASLIAQPSFNPLPWTKEQAEGWKDGLWSAAQRFPGIIGINPMGVGQVFDVVAEGVSSIVAHVNRTADKSGYLARAKSHDREELLIHPLQ